MATLSITATNKRGQSIPSEKFLGIYRAEDGHLFTGNKGYDDAFSVARKNPNAVGAIQVGVWLDLAKQGGIANVDAALSDYLA